LHSPLLAFPVLLPPSFTVIVPAECQMRSLCRPRRESVMREVAMWAEVLSRCGECPVSHLRVRRRRKPPSTRGMHPACPSAAIRSRDVALRLPSACCNITPLMRGQRGGGTRQG
jgi:hypothetical protein